jgi:hypothetical protein
VAGCPFVAWRSIDRGTEVGPNFFAAEFTGWQAALVIDGLDGFGALVKLLAADRAVAIGVAPARYNLFSFFLRLRAAREYLRAAAYQARIPPSLPYMMPRTEKERSRKADRRFYSLMPWECGIIQTDRKYRHMWRPTAKPK